MNNLHLQERLVALKQREVGPARLLSEAGLFSSNLLARAVQSLRNLLTASREKRQDHRSLRQQSY